MPRKIEKKLRLLFAAGDVGGARAILPVARLAHCVGHSILALNHGILRQEGEVDWVWLTLKEACEAKCDAVIYSTSVDDLLAFKVAWSARQHDIPIVHVLDNWSLYGKRLRGKDLDDQPQTLIPDLYSVMDNVAYSGAIEDGVPIEILRETGHPGLANLEQELEVLGSAETGETSILFISEPVIEDSGSAQSINGRGYDEFTVTHAFLAALARLPDLNETTINVVPHPREDRTVVEKRWEQAVSKFLPGSKFALVPPNRVRYALHKASHVVGMTSLILYEAWLLEKPTLSLQPNLRWPHLASLGEREGVIMCTTEDDVFKDTAVWSHQVGPIGTGKGSRLAHCNASVRLLDFLQNL